MVLNKFIMHKYHNSTSSHAVKPKLYALNKNYPFPRVALFNKNRFFFSTLKYFYTLFICDLV